ncbi:MAG: hypothetical protein DFNUSKGM_000204 [Candidatus Fervidibacter sacchari]
MHRRSLIADLAEALGKSEEEVRQFLEALWQRLPLAIEIEPPFVRYLDAKIEGVRSTLEAEIKGLRSALEAEINGLRMAMEQGFKRSEERDEALRREMDERLEALRREMQQGFQQMAERDEAIRRELRQEIEALRSEVQRLERWFRTFAISILLMLAGIIVQNFLK